MEEEEGRKEDEGKLSGEERAKLEERLAAIEADLDKACKEEEYDRAGESHSRALQA